MIVGKLLAGEAFMSAASQPATRITCAHNWPIAVATSWQCRWPSPCNPAAFFVPNTHQERRAALTGLAVLVVSAWQAVGTHAGSLRLPAAQLLSVSDSDSRVCSTAE